jgi:hypothetical protein
LLQFRLSVPRIREWRDRIFMPPRLSRRLGIAQKSQIAITACGSDRELQVSEDFRRPDFGCNDPLPLASLEMTSAPHRVRFSIPNYS